MFSTRGILRLGETMAKKMARFANLFLDDILMEYRKYGNIYGIHKWIVHKNMEYTVI